MKEKIRLVALLALFLYQPASAYASWYVVDNYEGQIGPYPVHVSLQKYDGYGSGLNVKGSYFYDKYRAPIALYGKYTDGAFELCEVHSSAEYSTYLEQGSKTGFDTHSCPFKLTENADQLRGIWQDRKKSHEVVLQHSNSFDQTSAQKTVKENIEIPFWGQTSSHSFVGVYQSDGSGITLNEVKVINKATGNVDQVINPQLHDCEFGFFMTAIYQNIESGSDRSQILLNCYSRRADMVVEYRFDMASQQYLAVDYE